MTKPSRPSTEVSHHPLLHLPTSTIVPFGMMVRTGLSVPADLRRLVSAVVAIGLAVAQTADRSVKTAVDAAILARLMAILVSLLPARPRSLFTRSRPLLFKASQAVGCGP